MLRDLPGGERFDHHAVRYPQPAAGTIVRDPDRGVLLIWRHRFITDTWGWEIPAGRSEPGESPEEAAVRETIEETLAGLEGDESERALEVARDRARRLTSLRPEVAYGRLVSFLARRGYDGGTSREAARVALDLDGRHA